MHVTADEDSSAVFWTRQRYSALVSGILAPQRGGNLRMVTKLYLDFRLWRA
jgi:hypothetical protein